MFSFYRLSFPLKFLPSPCTAFVTAYIYFTQGGGCNFPGWGWGAVAGICSSNCPLCHFTSSAPLKSTKQSFLLVGFPPRRQILKKPLSCRGQLPLGSSGPPGSLAWQRVSRALQPAASVSWVPSGLLRPCSAGNRTHFPPPGLWEEPHQHLGKPQNFFLLEAVLNACYQMHLNNVTNGGLKWKTSSPPHHSLGSGWAFPVLGNVLAAPPGRWWAREGEAGKIQAGEILF